MYTAVSRFAMTPMLFVLTAGFLLMYAGSYHFTTTLFTQSAGAAPFACPVTQPNGRTYTAEPVGGNHGNDAQYAERRQKKSLNLFFQEA